MNAAGDDEDQSPITNHQSCFFLAAAALVAWSGFVAAADPWPVKPIRLIVPYAAGGTGDIIGRLVGGKLAEVVGQSVVVENRPGAGGNIGAEATVRAAPDGYTVVIAATSLASNPSLQRKMPFDPLKDLAAAGGCCEVATILVVHPSLPVKSVREFIALAKANPAKLSFASSGHGTTSHLAAELFKVIATRGPRPRAVQGGLGGDARRAVGPRAGDVHAPDHGDAAGESRQAAGRSRVSTAERSPLVPDLPTVGGDGPVRATRSARGSGCSFRRARRGTSWNGWGRRR